MRLQSRVSASCCAFFLAVHAGAADDYQAHCLYLGEAPSGQTDWSDSIAGLAHDNGHWYITQGQMGASKAIWRIPVSYDLLSVHADSPGVLRRTVFPELALDGDDEWAFGDPCLYRFGGVDYLIVPYAVNTGFDIFELLAVFDAQTLQAIDRVNLPSQSYSACGVDQQGHLYLSRMISNVSFVQQWTLDWSNLQQNGELQIQFAAHVHLYDENGVELPFLPGGVNGLELTPDDRYLYAVGEDIHIFDVQTGRRLHKSTNAPNVFFPFYWDDSSSLVESPQGLCIWNLEGTGSPHAGTLHVLVRDWDIIGDDDVFLKHYTAELHVHLNAPAPWTGAPWDPFPTVTAAVNTAWLGADIRIDSGIYDEALTINKRVRLRTNGGTTRIGG